MPWLWTMDFEKLIHTPNIPYFNPRSNPILSLFRSLKDNTSKASSPKIYLKVKESLGKTFYIPLSTPYEQLLCVAVAPACDWSALKRSLSKVFGKKTDETLGRKFNIPLSSPYEQLCVAVAPACDWSTLKRVAQLLEVEVAGPVALLTPTRSRLCEINRAHLANLWHWCRLYKGWIVNRCEEVVLKTILKRCFWRS